MQRSAVPNSVGKLTSRVDGILDHTIEIGWTSGSVIVVCKQDLTEMRLQMSETEVVALATMVLLARVAMQAEENP